MTPSKKDEPKTDAEIVKTIETHLKPEGEKPSKYDRSGRPIGTPNPLPTVDDHIAEEPK